MGSLAQIWTVNMQVKRAIFFDWQLVCDLVPIYFRLGTLSDSFITQDMDEQIRGGKVEATFSRGHISLGWDPNQKKGMEIIFLLLPCVLL